MLKNSTGNNCVRFNSQEIARILYLLRPYNLNDIVLICEKFNIIGLLTEYPTDPPLLSMFIVANSKNMIRHCVEDVCCNFFATVNLFLGEFDRHVHIFTDFHHKCNWL